MQELDKDQTEHVAGALRIKIKWPPIKRPPVTTLAVGEEGGPITTLALGEEGSPIVTTLALGEEGGGGITTTDSPLGTF